MKLLFIVALTGVIYSGAVMAQKQASDFLVYQAEPSKDKKKHVVFIAGDEEYRSEQALPLLADIASKHGFKSTVLFSTDEDGLVDPQNQGSLSNYKALETADALVLSIRFRHWDDQTMTAFDNALRRGVPIIALRTSTHAFKIPQDSKWAKYDFKSEPATGWAGGFGKEVLGTSWVSHHGKHKKQGTRTHVEEKNAKHPLLRGVGEIFSKTDVYGAKLPQDAEVLLRGEVVETLYPQSVGVTEKNTPMQPVAWYRHYRNATGKVNKVLTVTLGDAMDFQDEDMRRLVINGLYWGTGNEVPVNAAVPIEGEYHPTMYGFATHQQGLKPQDFKLGGRANRLEDQMFNASKGLLTLPTQEFKRKRLPSQLKVKQGESIALIGGGMGSRMMKFNDFETELYLRHPEHDLRIRNMCDEGNTPGFRQHPGRSFENQFAFPGAKQLVDPQFLIDSVPKGHFETADQWLGRHKADTIVAFFGFNSSFFGVNSLPRFEKEFTGFLKHTLTTKYNQKRIPQLAVVSPTAFQDLSKAMDVPDGVRENVRLALYTDAMKKICVAHGVLFIDAFSASQKWYQDGRQYTIDGALLNDLGYRKLSVFLADSLYGKKEAKESLRLHVKEKVTDKNWAWYHDYKIGNGVHVFGRRYRPYGPQNYPFELTKVRQMTAIRDQAIWSLLKGQKFDVAEADKHTLALPEVPTNYKPSEKNGDVNYRSAAETHSKLSVPEGYKVELFASEKQFPNLANPCQMAFDNKGRLWVSTMASYPHFRIGDPKPADKLLILEDTDGDGKADKETVFAADLHLPIGFEIAAEGVYVSQSDSVVLLKDTDGDDRYDVREVILSGFDDHDTHHAISAFCADPSGAILMGEGIFSHTGVETAYGPVWGSNGGFYRYAPQTKKLTRHAQLEIPNPWGIAFDDYGQPFFLHSSNTNLSWMKPGSVKPRYGVNMPAKSLVVYGKVRPTSGLEVVSSRHFPEEVQGDLILSNSIGFLGAKQHKVTDSGTGYSLSFRHDLFKSEDKNFRPVDLEFAPDGSLYFVDWHNVLIGHMQHNARDPHRDHKHGRIYRITYPSRPLVKPAEIDEAPIAQLLENLKLHEYRSRYRTKRELRGRDPKQVAAAAVEWAKNQTEDRHKLEALWVTWGANRVSQPLLTELLQSKNYKVRAAAAAMVRHNLSKLENTDVIFDQIAEDSHGRVRIEAVIAASFMEVDKGLSLIAKVKQQETDKTLLHAIAYAESGLRKDSPELLKKKVVVPAFLKGKGARFYEKGEEIYHREGHCATCHQADGKGLPAAGFPPLDGSKWVVEDKERLIKLTLHGLMGPIEVKGRKYPGHVPMTAFGEMLIDTEVSQVLTYIRNSFGNKADTGVKEDWITPELVKKVRLESMKQKGFYKASELLELHPHKE